MGRGMLLVVFILGCGQSAPEVSKSPPPAPTEGKTGWPTTAEGLAKLVAQGKANAEKAKGAQEALLVSLKTDTRPIYDTALEHIKKSLAKQIGDDAAREAIVTVDESSLKTFGPEKWKVRGRFSGIVNGQKRETTWQAEVNASGGKLYPGNSQLQVPE